MKIIFAGTPDFSVACLQALLDAGHEIVAVYCQPDRPAGRGRKLQSGPVKRCAEANNLDIYQPLSLKNAEDQSILASHQADLMIVVAYGLILPQVVLDTPKLGCINVHASLLPRWRGAAPIQRAIEAGDSETGVTIMQMDAGLDTGDMLQKSTTTITANMTGGELHDALAISGAEALVGTISLLPEQINPISQDDGLANYAHKLSKAEAQINWSHTAATIHNKVRAFNPWPVCWTEHQQQRLRVWKTSVVEGSAPVGEVVRAGPDGLIVGAGEGLIAIQTLQAAGSKPLSISEFANGHDIASWVGTRFNS